MTHDQLGFSFVGLGLICYICSFPSIDVVSTIVCVCV